MTAGHRGLEQSVMTRLATLARSLGVDPNVILVRFVTERFLYRLSKSSHAARFILKGATLMPLWLGDTARPTRDADLAGLGDMSAEALTLIFGEICEVVGELDAVSYDVKTMHIDPIRASDQYGGHRMTVDARIGRSRIPLQIDIGIGDAVSPSPVEVELPVLLAFPAPRLLAYRPETSIAEKFHAIVTLGSANSRMKDFYDIDRLAAGRSFDTVTMRKAIEQTFRRRGTDLPDQVPVGLTEVFATSADKQKQWQAFAGRVSPGATEAFSDVVSRVRDFLMPMLEKEERS